MRLVLPLALVGACSFSAQTPSDTPDAGNLPRPDARLPGPDAIVVVDGPGVPDATPPVPDARPAVTETFGERTGSDHDGVSLDTYLDSRDPSQSFVSLTYMQVDSGSQASTALMYFDVSAIPAGATVTAASLTLHTTPTGGGDPVQVYPILEGWSSSATWFERSGGQLWASPGAEPPSRGTTAIGTFPGTSNDTDYTAALDPATVQGWLEGPNLGVAIAMAGNNATLVRSSNSSITTERPLLSVTYTPP